MVDDQVYLQGMDDLGLEMTQDEIRTFALNRFAPPGAPLIAPESDADADRRTSGDGHQHRRRHSLPRRSLRRSRQRRCPARQLPARRVWPHRYQGRPSPHRWRSSPRRPRPPRIPPRRARPPRRDLPNLQIGLPPGAPLAGGLRSAGRGARSGPSESQRCAGGDCRTERAAGARGAYPPSNTGSRRGRAGAGDRGWRRFRRPSRASFRPTKARPQTAASSAGSRARRWWRRSRRPPSPWNRALSRSRSRRSSAGT